MDCNYGNYYQLFQSHELRADYDCLYCGIDHKCKEELKHHIHYECKEKPAWNWFCINCGAEYQTKKALDVHGARWCLEKN